MQAFKDKVIGTIGYIKGQMLTKKGEKMLQKAAELQHKGEKYLGWGQTLQALKVQAAPAPVAYGAPPAPAAPAYSAPAPAPY